MPTYIERTGADGLVRVKALARVWVNGKQVNRVKTFYRKDGRDYKERAEAWASKMESELKAKKARLVYEKSLVTEFSEEDILWMKNLDGGDDKTISDMFMHSIAMMNNIMRFMGEAQLNRVNVSTIMTFILGRHGEAASKKQIEAELQLLKSLISQHCPDQKADIIGIAYQAAQADGAVFTPD